MLPLVEFVEILAFPEKMCQADLVIKEVQGEVCAVAVGHGGHPFERVSEAVFKLLPLAALAVKHQREVHSLCYPCLVKPFVAIASGLVKTHHG